MGAARADAACANGRVSAGGVCRKGIAAATCRAVAESPSRPRPRGAVSAARPVPRKAPRRDGTPPIAGGRRGAPRRPTCSRPARTRSARRLYRGSGRATGRAGRTYPNAGREPRSLLGCRDGGTVRIGHADADRRAGQRAVTIERRGGQGSRRPGTDAPVRDILSRLAVQHAGCRCRPTEGSVGSDWTIRQGRG
jgi:hypothetical protein